MYNIRYNPHPQPLGFIFALNASAKSDATLGARLPSLVSGVSLPLLPPLPVPVVPTLSTLSLGAGGGAGFLPAPGRLGGAGGVGFAFANAGFAEPLIPFIPAG